MKFEQIDEKFAVKPADDNGMCYYNCIEDPFKIYGLIKGENTFVRIPQNIADTVSDNVKFLNTHSAGGRVKFVTNSPKIAIRAKMSYVYRWSHFTFCGSSGFDLYADIDQGEKYVGTFLPPIDMKDGYSSTLNNPDGETMHEFTINFPLYSSISSLEVGICEGYTLTASKGYRDVAPIVYYGSSITQGGCASRPGNTYQSIISRRINVDHVNLGFSGSAKGEQAMADYISTLDMSVFVLDYDANAPTLEHLEATHENFFKTVRTKNPTLPIIMISRPRATLDNAMKQRRQLIYDNYKRAKDSGDKNVYFLDGEALLNIFGGDSTSVDGSHPNDLGFMCMATGVGDLIEKILN